jgi:hypothetical protein
VDNERKIRMHRFLTGKEGEGIKPIFGLTALRWIILPCFPTKLISALGQFLSGWHKSAMEDILHSGCMHLSNRLCVNELSSQCAIIHSFKMQRSRKVYRSGVRMTWTPHHPHSS